jgi:hypothetical protein
VGGSHGDVPWRAAVADSLNQKAFTMRLAFGIVGITFLVGVGCSSSKSIPMEQAELEIGTGLVEVGDLLRTYTEETGRAPTNAANVVKYEALFPRGVLAIRSGSVTVVWGVEMPPVGKGGKEIIAYEKKVETGNGGVLLMNGEVKRMSPGEFASAPKAGKR